MPDPATTARGCWLAIILITGAFLAGATLALLGYAALFRALSLYWR